MTDLTQHIKWKNDFQKLEDDYDSLREYFMTNKKCRCHRDTCKHFDKVLKEVLGERIDETFQRRMNIGFNTFISIQKRDNSTEGE